MAENTENTAQEQEQQTEKTFTQSEVDALIGRRIAKAMKGVPSEEELTAYRTWKASQQTEQDKLNNITKERDTATAQLAAANTELEQYRREKFLLGKGVSADDVDYYSFKIGKMVTDTLTFEQAAETFLKEKNAPGTVRVSMGASLTGGNVQQKPNEQMNSLLRGLRK
jgi:hypothetical protein